LSQTSAYANVNDPPPESMRNTPRKCMPDQMDANAYMHALQINVLQTTRGCYDNNNML